MLEDIKKLGLENSWLKRGPKGKVGNPSKKIKIEEDKKTKELQKEIKSLKKQVHQIRGEASKALNKWEEKYVANTEKQKEKLLK